MESPICAPDDPSFRLIETFRWEPGLGAVRGDAHLARLRRTAHRLGIELRGVSTVMESISGEGPLRVRLIVDSNGKAEVTAASYQPAPEGAVWRLVVSPTPLQADNPWLRVKTTQRSLYDQARATLPDDADEVLFANENGDVCEGTITNVFAQIDGTMVTPALSCGLLPGVLRGTMLEAGDCSEARLTMDDLHCATKLWVGNSLRGMIPARLVQD